jgi:hypothetical protein
MFSQVVPSSDPCQRAVKVSVLVSANTTNFAESVIGTRSGMNTAAPLTALPTVTPLALPEVAPVVITLLSEIRAI